MPHTLRRLLAGACLVAAPLVYVAGLVVDPALRAGDAADGAYGRHPGQVSVSAALLHWSWVLLVPGILGMIHLVRRRAVLFGHIAGAVALLGVVNFSSLMLGDFFYARLEADLGTAEGDRLADASLGAGGAVWGFQVPGFLGLLGVLLLGLALAYDRQVPWWAPPAMVAGMLAAPVYPIGMVVGSLLYLAGAGVIGVRMLRMSDADWAQAPAPSGNVAATV
ncbi:hypothetical protein Daura_44505 [Dactylosporangium aurantiacum]|uniref:Uncharacterized protein n=1 Tax=Dactylosporangium aurantiacum TaxID=35754 RepID=A0A9Q9ID16_9ACTN|nr:hypothetical protein [Dactylosporangium aurantiacum]MDG6102158.1 hypothetical protein [Dactylosporangium aurantiacum]UWZ53521.1 hypothetical protein Daura_44505 [Dactylosporangium aurantiacum]